MANKQSVPLPSINTTSNKISDQNTFRLCYFGRIKVARPWYSKTALSSSSLGYDLHLFTNLSQCHED